MEIDDMVVRFLSISKIRLCTFGSVRKTLLAPQKTEVFSLIPWRHRMMGEFTAMELAVVG